MLVSIIVPTRNMAHYLRWAIESILRQSYENWELHVVDDGSTDATPEVVAQFLNDPRVRYWTQRNQERAAARNRGIASSSGEYIAFLDSDDLWDVDKLRKQISALKSDLDAGLCYTYARYIDPEGTPLRTQLPRTARDGYALPQLLRGNFIPISSVMVRRNVLEAVGTFDTGSNLIGSEDWDLWLRIAKAYPVRLVPEELTFYRVHNTPRSHRLMLDGAMGVLDKHFANPEFPTQVRMTKRKAKAYAYLCSAGFASPSLARSERLKLFLKGTSLAPTSIASPAGVLALARLLLPPNFK